MVDIFEDRLSIDAGCASDIPVNTNTRFQGSVSYHLVNNGDEDGIINIFVTLSDSAGHSEPQSFTLTTVPAKGDFTDSHQVFLNASYENPGPVTVTMQIQFSGALNDTKFAQCGFNVLG